jgi:hypothetical protein
MPKWIQIVTLIIKMVPLQTKFLISKGQPINVDGNVAVQMDRIPIKCGTVTVSFLSAKSPAAQGVAFKSAKGGIKLSDGKKVKLVYVWDEKKLPKVVRHEVVCPDGVLRLWNIYKIGDERDLTRADAWTNNAGMVIDELGLNKRRYRCSDGLGEFDPDDLIFEVEWEQK